MFDFDVVTGPTPAELAAMRRQEKAAGVRPADAARRPAESAAPTRTESGAAQSTSR